MRLDSKKNNSYGIAFEFIKQFAPEDATFVIFYANVEKYKDRFSFANGWALRSLPGHQQVSQVLELGFEWEKEQIYNVISHELSHSDHFFLGIPDLTHHWIRQHGGNWQKAHFDMFRHLAPYAKQLDTGHIGEEPKLVTQRKMSRMEFYVLLAKAIQKHEGWFKGSRSQRNNNPGNLRSSPFQSGIRDNFSYFKNFDTGWHALIWDIDWKFTGRTSSRLNGNSTLLEFFQVYAPAGDNNNPKAYVLAVVADLRKAGLNINHLTRLWELLALTEKENPYMFLAQPKGSALIALVIDGVRHDLSFRAWRDYLDQKKPVVVDPEWFNALQRGKPFTGGVNFGEVDEQEFGGEHLPEDDTPPVGEVIS